MADVGISTDVVDSNTLWRRFFTAIELLLLACDEMDGDPDLEDGGETGDAVDEVLVHSPPEIARRFAPARWREARRAEGRLKGEGG